MSVWTRTRAALGLPVMGSRIGRVGEMVQHTEAGVTMPASATVAQEVARVRGIHAFHRSLGWQGFGYSAISFASGRCYEGRGGGRSGSHTQGRNGTALAICSAGHGDRTALTEPQIVGERRVMGRWVADGHLTPNCKVSGHRNYSSKSCPGSRVYPQLHRLRGVTAADATTSTAPTSPTPAPRTLLERIKTMSDTELAAFADQCGQRAAYHVARLEPSSGGSDLIGAVGNASSHARNASAAAREAAGAIEALAESRNWSNDAQATRIALRALLPAVGVLVEMVGRLAADEGVEVRELGRIASSLEVLYEVPDAHRPQTV